MPRKMSRKMLLCIVGISCLGVVAAFMWWDVLKQLYPSQKSIDDKAERLRRIKRELRKEVDEGKAVEVWLEKCRHIAKDNFISETDAVGLRRRLETAARQHGLVVMAIGTPSETKLKAGSVWQINLSAYGTLKDMMGFLEELSVNEKKLFWRRFSLRPMSSRSSERLRLTATVCAFSMDARSLEKLETGKKDPRAKKVKQKIAGVGK